MKNLIKATVIAATIMGGMGTVSVNMAQAQSFELVTGIGFGTSRRRATSNAIRAWVRQARVDYPGVNPGFNSALRSRINCDYEPQNNNGGGYSTRGTGIAGNVDGAWSCTVFGIPAAAING